MDIPEYVVDVINRIEENGFPAYVVGGCVRDYLIGRETHDFDIASPALPEKILEIFSDYTTFTNGMKHGTIILLSNKHIVEVTTFRSDGTYSDSRRPDSVLFVRSIEEDLSRRDFTINAMAYRKCEGIIDPYGGQADLKNKIIRCVGNPYERFSEDALRIMRGIRFSSVLGFKIEAETMSAMLETKYLLNRIAKERITVELRAMLLGIGDNVYETLMQCREIIYELIPELRVEDNYIMEKYPNITLWEHTARAVSMTTNIYERLCMLLHDVAKPFCKIIIDGKEKYPSHAEKGAELAEKILSRFRFDKLTNTAVLKLIKNHSLEFPTTLIDMRKFVREFGYDFTNDWLEIKYADIFSKPHKESTEQLYYNAVKFFDKIYENHLCCVVSELDISGNELKEMGFVGREIGITLEKLLDRVISEKCENKKEALIKQTLLLREDYTVK